ncbi:MAG: crotonyl-CoA carboxylase/reductase [Actinomycetota bacterium]|nr:crotonyl-CoA carboxylase/reductase [Actinomycetota bacterium]
MSSPGWADAVVAGAPAEELEHLPLPDSFRAVVVRSDEADRWEGVPLPQRDPGQTLRVEEVDRPALAPDDVLVAVMASSINYTTVWSALGYPASTFAFLRRLGPPHDLPYHVVGSDAAGVILRAGAGVRRWRVGDHVVVNPSQVDTAEPEAHDDALLAPSQRVWGYETNFGGLAELALVRASQLLPKPAHLTWEEAGSLTLCASTAYRMLVGQHGARMKQGDVVLVWGATGGVGSFAVQLVLNGGGMPVGVVSSPAKAALLQRIGCEAVIDRAAEGYRFWADEHTPDQSEWRRFGARIREVAGVDPDIVVEHPGRETMGASVYVTRRGGTVVTCAATSGYRLEIDNRHLWMRLKRIVGTQLANLSEAAAMNTLVCRGRIHPTLAAVFPLDQTAEAARAMYANRHQGKLGVLCLAPSEGLGVTDMKRREQLWERLHRFREGGPR